MVQLELGPAGGAAGQLLACLETSAAEGLAFCRGVWHLFSVTELFISGHRSQLAKAVPDGDGCGALGGSGVVPAGVFLAPSAARPQSS